MRARGFLLFLLLVCFSSCEFYHFTEPQPYDRGDLFQFPDAMLGKWVPVPDTTPIEFKVDIPLKNKGGEASPAAKGRSGEDRSFYLIRKDHLLLVFDQQEKVVQGAWPRYDPEKGYEYPPLGYRSMRTIGYDSLNRPVDTTEKYILQGDRLYEMDGDRFLNRGYGCTQVRDTFLVHQIDSIYVDLGHNAFLRPLSDSLFVLNLNSAITSTGDHGGWWYLVVLEIRSDGNLVQWECNDRTGELSCMFYSRDSKFSQYYFNCRWTAAEMLRLKTQGYWERGEVMKRVGE